MVMARSIQPLFQQTIEKAHDWLHELTDIGGLRDDAQAYSVLRAVLHALRDRLVPGEAIDLAAEMPLLIKGIYFDGFRLTQGPEPVRHWDDFIEAVRNRVPREPDWDVQSGIAAVFELLSRKISPGEIEDVRNMLPKEIAEMFPGPRESRM
jgi:uncharacterized protein (DUF2267 family)